MRKVGGENTATTEYVPMGFGVRNVNMRASVTRIIQQYAIHGLANANVRPDGILRIALAIARF